MRRRPIHWARAVSEQVIVLGCGGFRAQGFLDDGRAVFDANRVTCNTCQRAAFAATPVGQASRQAAWTHSRGRAAVKAAVAKAITARHRAEYEALLDGELAMFELGESAESICRRLACDTASVEACCDGAS